MSESRRKTRTVYEAFVAVAEQHAGGPVRPGDLVAHLRAGNNPFGSWEVRGELSNLEALCVAVVDPVTGTWRLVEGADLEQAEAAGNGR